MRRADRLFQIVQLLRRGRATTAAQIAGELEVSERTIYRDVQDLVCSGVPIQGEAGVGYALPARFDLPPLMFDAQEIAALVLGARMVESWSDRALAQSAKSALRKVGHVLPERLAAKIEKNRLYAPEPQLRAEEGERMALVRQALEESLVLHLTYTDETGAASERDLRPLGLFFWGRTWTLAAWCELRKGFRSFRLDRMQDIGLTGRSFAPTPGQTLEDFFALVRAEREQQPVTSRTERHKKRVAPPDDPSARESWKAFQELGSVGPACAKDFLALGFRKVADLKGQDANVLYARLCELTQSKQDPCVEDVLRCAVVQAEHPRLPAKWKNWWTWTPWRGLSAGALPPELSKALPSPRR
jgi:predicted DNA-binding transcriptional regulator YafY